jgi:hypothetical protein
MNRPQIWLDDSGISTWCQATDMFVSAVLWYTMAGADRRAAGLVEGLESLQRRCGAVTRTEHGRMWQEQVNGHGTRAFFP